MLSITIPENEIFNEKTNQFIQIPETTLQLEHSLVSISKWERKWHKAFLKDEPQKTNEEMIDYIRCMTLTQHVSPLVYLGMTGQNIKDVRDYINNPMTAVCFPDDDDKNKNPLHKDVVTNELVYYWMIKLGIPVEFQKWHLNALLSLIKVCNMKDAPQKKLSQHEAAQRQRALKAANRAKRGKH